MPWPYFHIGWAELLIICASMLSISSYTVWRCWAKNVRAPSQIPIISKPGQFNKSSEVYVQDEAKRRHLFNVFGHCRSVLEAQSQRRPVIDLLYNIFKSSVAARALVSISNFVKFFFISAIWKYFVRRFLALDIFIRMQRTVYPAAMERTDRLLEEDLCTGCECRVIMKFSFSSHTVAPTLRCRGKRYLASQPTNFQMQQRPGKD